MLASVPGDRLEASRRDLTDEITHTPSTRHQQVGSEVGERIQYERTTREALVRDREPRRFELDCTIDEQVEINPAGSPAGPRLTSTKRLLESLQAVEQCLRFQLRQQSDRGIDEVRLVPRAHRRRSITT